jgi:nucleoside-diphosphate-sugar epimerase
VDSIVPLTGGICPRENNGWPLYNPQDYNNFSFVKDDCRAFFNQCADNDFDEVYHLAAMVGGREIIENNPLAVAEDLAVDPLFWKWAEKVRPKRIVCFSSSAAYPIKFQQRERYVLLQEDMIDFDGDIGMSDLSYGWSKLTHEYLGRLAYRKYGLKSVTYRPFSGYGEDQDFAYPFPSICRRALLKEQGVGKFVVWGSGDQVRDFTHISDCIAGILSTMYEVDDGSAINLSTGVGISFNEFASMATDIVGYRPEILSITHNFHS